MVLINLRINGRRTTVRLERAFFEGLRAIADREGKTPQELCELVANTEYAGTLTSALRVFVLTYFRRLSDRRPPVEAPDDRPPPPPLLDPRAGRHQEQSARDR